jgi:hypothetical protein
MGLNATIYIAGFIEIASAIYNMMVGRHTGTDTALILHKPTSIFPKQ